jgi:hypothetical protein
LHQGEDEVQPNFDAQNLATMECDAEDNNDTPQRGRKSSDFIKLSLDDFKKLDKEDIAIATIYEMKYGSGPDEKIVYEILPDGKHIEKKYDPMKYPEQLEFKNKIDFKSKTFPSLFFEHCFPSVQGHGKRMDEYYSRPGGHYYETVQTANFKFHDESNADPDWIIKQCYLLLIAAVTEGDVGIHTPILDNTFQGTCLLLGKQLLHICFVTRPGGMKSIVTRIGILLCQW